MIVAGLGCRRTCDVGDLLAALDQALAQACAERRELSALYAPEFKRGQPALAQLSSLLDKPLHFLPLALLQAEQPLLLSPSQRVLTEVGVASVSESAALAGARSLAGGAPQLRHARSISGGATCALAFVELAPRGALFRNET